MRILLINPNCTEAVTERLAAAARRMASLGSEITAVTAPSGIAFIETPAQSRATVDAVLDVLAGQGADHDAAIIAAYSDPGLAEARAQASVPVFGIAEASMQSAAALADRFAIVTAGDALVATLWDLAEAYGVRNRLARILVLPQALARIAGEPEAFLDGFRRLCTEAIERDGAGALIIGGGPMAGLSDWLATEFPVPLLDGVACAVRRAEQTLNTM
jgi:Asp/Glu/hydantoin racemase